MVPPMLVWSTKENVLGVHLTLAILVKRQEYIRTKAAVKAEIKRESENDTAQKGLPEMRLSNLDDPGAGPRNSKQVRNARYLGKKDTRLDGMKLTNFADNVVIVEQRAKGGHDFVRRVITGPGNVPSVILYTDQQIADIKRFCCSSSSAHSTVLSIDKTYNLGDMFVTVSCFKNLAVTN